MSRRRKKEFPCMVCEKLHFELEDAEVCERSHDRERHPDEDDGQTYDDPRDELDRRREREGF